MSSKLQPAAKPRLPRQIGFIIGNEACERFSFYGMRNILVPFLAASAAVFFGPGLSEKERGDAALEVFHTFVIGVYFFPLLGGWLADRFLGKYQTILWLSVIYGIGSAALAYYVNSKAGFYAGLFLIALGSGGIKPCVSAFVGDQFDQSNKSLAKVVFDAFYWIINFGSFFASLLMPWVLNHPSFGGSVERGARWAFGIPAVLMFLSTLVFWLGRPWYVRVPPTKPHPDSFLRVVRSAVLPSAGQRWGFGTVLAGLGVATSAQFIALAIVQGLRELRWVDVPAWLIYLPLSVTQLLCLAIVALVALVGIGARLQLDRARTAHPPEAVDGAKNVLSILVLFFLVTPFWSLFDQKASTWILQGRAMAAPEFLKGENFDALPTAFAWLLSPFKDFKAAQMQALNPILVMLLIPLNNVFLYPFLRRRGIEPTALRRMGTGIAFAGLAWVVAGSFQLLIDGGRPLSIFWQAVPYLLLTMGEVWVSATGLEFAYSQAPPSMKGAIMAFWSLSVTIGNLWVLLVKSLFNRPDVARLIEQTGLGDMAFRMYFFAGMAFVAALLFGLYAARYTPADHYRPVDRSTR